MRQNKCPACGLVNYSDATACQRCGHSLGAHTFGGRDGLRRVAAPGAFAPWRGRLFSALFVVSVACGGTYVYRHPATTAVREAITSRVTGEQPSPRSSSGPPHLGDDAKKPARAMTVEEFERALDGGGGGQPAGQSEELNRPDVNRRFEEEHDRALRAGMQQERHADDQTHNDRTYQQPAGNSHRRY